MTCSPSAKLESKLIDVSSSYADEGTLAHELSELLIGYAVGKIDKHQYEIDLKIIKSRKYYSVSMHEHCDDFKTYVIEIYNTCRVIDPHTVIFLETRLDISEFIPEGFGTADIIILCAGKLIIIDLKYGQGITVDVEDNGQLKVYALGALRKFDCIFDIDIVELHIYQPRKDNICSWQISTRNLLKWGMEEVIPGALKAWAGEGEFVPGEHCRFCKVKTKCAAFSKFVDDLYKPKLLPGMMTPEQISEVLRKHEIVKEWLNSVYEMALIEAVEKGVKWPEFKLVEGKSNRIISDEIKAIEILQAQKLAKSEFMRTSLKPLGELENLVGKKQLAVILEPILLKPKGKPTLVPVSDKREEINSAKNAFHDLEFDTLDD
jgi:hypothetical protein